MGKSVSLMDRNLYDESYFIGGCSFCRCLFCRSRIGKYGSCDNCLFKYECKKEWPYQTKPYVHDFKDIYMSRTKTVTDMT